MTTSKDALGAAAAFGSRILSPPGRRQRLGAPVLRIVHDSLLAGVVIARTFIEAVNDGRHDDAAALLTEDVEVVFHGARLQGREAWLESRTRHPPPEHLREEVAIDELSETPDGAEVSGRMVQRWVESGEVAGEQPVRIVVTVVDGLIARLELSPVEGA